MLTSLIFAAVSLASQPATQPAHAQQPAAETPPPSLSPEQVAAAESKFFAHPVQLTSRDMFIKAGEAYFSPDGDRIVFQALAVPEQGKEADPFYAMYVAKLKRDSAGMPCGLDNIQRISSVGSANTCGWFHPKHPEVMLFGSTVIRPHDESKSGFQVGTHRYKWMFPEEMEVCTITLQREAVSGQATTGLMPVAAPLFSRPNYDAECSFDSSGRFVLYAHVEDHKPDEKADANIYVYDTRTKKHTVIVDAKGYDGGPFFSPDGKWICYRSDRKGDDLLQLFAAKLKFEKDADGTEIPVGIEHEYQLTDNKNVNWAPYWHPSGKFIVYASSEFSHANYEVFAVEFNPHVLAGHMPGPLARKRLTFADGADVLPVFSFDGKYMMWTAQRGPKAAGEAKPSSQLWIADWTAGSDLFSSAPEK